MFTIFFSVIFLQLPEMLFFLGYDATFACDDLFVQHDEDDICLVGAELVL